MQYRAQYFVYCTCVCSGLRVVILFLTVSFFKGLRKQENLQK